MKHANTTRPLPLLLVASFKSSPKLEIEHAAEDCAPQLLEKGDITNTNPYHDIAITVHVHTADTRRRTGFVIHFTLFLLSPF